MQLIITCQTCEEKITLSIYYGKNAIWNNKDGAKIANWQRHVDAGHNVAVTHTFFPGWKNAEYEADD